MVRFRGFAAAILGVVLLTCSYSSPVRAKDSSEETTGSMMRGKASYYANKFDGRRTASGETFRTDKLTCASRTLPFGTMIKVTNPRNGRSILVRVNDRGPHTPLYFLDLSPAAARAIGLRGSATVEALVLR
ncbi:MAG: septal ring lytic transglycosylase RlpA family protein [Gloeobacterales cyanobacterium]